jgi:hypothetical protein
MAFRVDPCLDGSFRLVGELDMATAPQLLESLIPDTKSGSDLRLDLSSLELWMCPASTRSSNCRRPATATASSCPNQ